MEQNSESILRLRQENGKLIADPTSTDASVSYGGTVLGEIAYIELRLFPRYRRKIAEEWGGHPFGSKWLGETPVISGVLRGNDPDMINVLFPNTTAGASRGRGIKGQLKGSVLPGADNEDREVKLLFAPNDSEHGDHVILYSAVPEIDIQTRIAFHLGREKGIAFAFFGVPINSAKLDVYQMDLRENLIISPT